MLLLGVVYWGLWTRAWPRIGGYKIEAKRHEDSEGREHIRYVKVKVGKGRMSWVQDRRLMGVVWMSRNALPPVR